MIKRELPQEFKHIHKVMDLGASKYGEDNWLQPQGKKSSIDDMHASMVRHLSDSILNNRKDEESGLDPLLHLATRALMLYTRLERDLIKAEPSKSVRSIHSPQFTTIKAPAKVLSDQYKELINTVNYHGYTIETYELALTDGFKSAILNNRKDVKSYTIGNTSDEALEAAVELVDKFNEIER